MEKWKIGVIALLLCALAGYGISQQKTENPIGPPQPVATPAPSKWTGKPLPAWPKITQWINTPAPVKLENWRGNVVFVEIFRTECPHCQDAAPFLVALNQRYKSRGLKMVSIQAPSKSDDPQNPEANWNAVQNWMKTRNFSWPSGFDENSQWFQKTLKGTHYPTMLVLDKNGNVIFDQTGHTTEKAVDLSLEIEKRLAGGKPSAAQIQNLADWLAKMIYGGDLAMKKALVEELSRR